MVLVAPAAERAVRFPSLRNSAFRWYLSTGGLAMFADSVEHVLGYWVLWEITHSPFWLGYAVFAHWLPFSLLSLHAGALADRYDNRVVIQVAQGMYIFCSLALGFLVLTDSITVWAMAVLLLVHGAAGAVGEPSSQVLIHGLVGRKDLMSALSLNAATRQAAQFVGPAIGGALLVTVGPGIGFLFNAVLYLPFILVLFSPQQIPMEKVIRPMGTWQGIKEGVAYVWGQPLVLGLTAMAAVPGLIIGGSYQAMMPAIASSFEVGPLGYSALLAASGLGAILGGVVLGAIGSLRGRGWVLVATTLGFAALVAGFALSPWFVLSLGLLLGVGATQVVSHSLSQALVQHYSPDALRGRVMGTYMMATMGPRMVSGISVGALGEALGPPAALALSAGLALAAVAAVAAAVPRLRALD